MHYYPSTMGEIVQAVMNDQLRFAKQGRKIKKVMLTRFQHAMILAEVPGRVSNFKNPVVETFMGYPLEISDEHGYACIQADRY